METFEEKVEKYMQCDKRTLAELLAIKELVDQNKEQTQPIAPRKEKPFSFPPNYGDWTVTCAV